MGTPKNLNQAITNGITEAATSGKNVQECILHHVEDFIKQGLQVAMFMKGESHETIALRMKYLFIDRGKDEKEVA